MLLQAALNGDRTRADHPAVPLSARELADDAAACVAAGAGAIHLHPRGDDGRETLEPEVVDAVVATVRAACRVPVGVTTGAWIEPDLDRRLRLIAAWREPAYASVNLSEAGAPEVMAALLAAGVGIEAGVWSAADADRLAQTRLAHRVTRVLVEPADVPAPEATSLVAAIHARLDDDGIRAPRLQHGDGEATWVLLDDAVRRGIDTRVGLEDSLAGPDGTPVAGNAQLVRLARARFRG